MIGVNHYSNGKWYIESRSDLYEIYIALDKFYKENFESSCGKALKVRIKYDMDLGLFILKYKLKGNLFSRERRFLMNTDIGLSRRIKYLFESIVARGVVNAPLSNIDIKFQPGIKEKGSMSKVNYLVNKFMLGSKRGYFSLYGKIY